MRTPSAELPFPPPARRVVDALPAGWSERWAELAQAVGVDPRARICVALSGGADSVYLLYLVALSSARPPLHAVHVAHALRGAASEEDARFCAELARSLDVPFARVEAPVDAGAGDLEQRARVARYRALCTAAVRANAGTVLTGHHADDSLESLLLRWMRGGDVATFAQIPARTELLARGALNPSARSITIARPLFALRREEVRAALARASIEWREDESNASERFARNRVRHTLIPALRTSCGERVDEHLRAFATAVEELERHCARWTSGLDWQAPLFAGARRGAGRANLGGSLRREILEALIGPLRRRALWRLLVEGTGRPPRAPALERALDLLERHEHGEVTLAGGWRLSLRPRWVHLDPPTPPRASRKGLSTSAQLTLPFEDALAPAERRADELACGEFALGVPGGVLLPDGRTIVAERVELPRGAGVPRASDAVELDAEGLPDRLCVRWIRAGERFHALGAPGARPLGRFLRDAGIPRHERAHVPLVCAGSEILWVAGVRPSDRRRVRPETTNRLRLHLRGGETNARPAATAPTDRR